MNLLILFVAGMAIMVPVFAAPVPVFSDLKYKYFSAAYAEPNETQTELLAQLLRDAPFGGSYLTVGSERAFLASSLVPNLQSTIIVDQIFDVLDYDLANLALLANANSLNDYKFLRFQANPQQIASRSRSASRFINGFKLFAHAPFFQWWQTTVREAQGSPAYSFFNNGNDVRFFPAQYSYIHNPVLFDRVHRRAEAGQFELHHAVIGDPIDSVASVLRPDTRLSIVDVSNLVGIGWLGPQVIFNFVQSLKPYLNPDAIVVMMIPTETGPIRIEDGAIIPWYYMRLRAADFFCDGAQEWFLNGFKDAHVTNPDNPYVSPRCFLDPSQLRAHFSPPCALILEN